MSNKFCGRCKTEKPLDDFAKNRARHDGLQSMCRICDKAKGQKWASENRKSAVARVTRYNKSEKGRTKRLERARALAAAGKTKRYKRDLAKHALVQHKRRAKLAGNGVFEITQKDLLKLKVSPCFYCGKKATTIDHVIPITKGGRHSVGNLVPACSWCNTSKNNHLLIVWKHKNRKATQ
jgi:5-methylcytosine-specific restriction endonuclease McrA